jgi:short-subunit dehydrogenase
MKIENQHIVITGANRGIGLGFAKACAQKNSHLILVMRKNEQNLIEELKTFGAQSVQIIEADLSSRIGVQELIGKLDSLPVDILFNNAGLLTGGLLDEQSIDEIYQMLQVNVNALIQLSHWATGKMLQQKKGKIINHSSVSAVMHFPCATTYAASKAAVAAFTACLEQELKGSGVSTLCLYTPGIKTRMFDDIDKKYSKNMEVPKDSISTDEYALKIISAIESDQTVLTPSGITGLAFQTATHFKSLFNFGVSKAFKGRV